AVHGAFLPSELAVLDYGAVARLWRISLVGAKGRDAPFPAGFHANTATRALRERVGPWELELWLQPVSEVLDTLARRAPGKNALAEVGFSIRQC
ncbi:hypothetical protein P6O24_15225, partial [Clostridium perfringens]|nr:hypothetical protein [Clostridium perfringens]